MGLDLEQVILPLQELASQWKSRLGEWEQHLGRALEAASHVDPQELRQRLGASRGRLRWPAAQPGEPLDRKYPAPSCPPDFSVLATDGSHIEADPHRHAQCYLINLGLVRLDYGEQPQARLASLPRLYWGSQDLALADPSGRHDEALMEGVLLNARRSVEELKLLAQLAEELPANRPALALVDGSLLLWGVAGPAFPPFIREALLNKGVIPALDRLKAASQSRPLAVAGYISFSRSTEVVNALRVEICPFEMPDCRLNCFTQEATQECQAVAGVLDRELFEEILDVGERSSLFLSHSSLAMDYYGEHQVHFFYIRGPEEIAKVEVPDWVAKQPILVDLVHAIALDQCRRGQGYPVALSEAHQQAVVTAADRENFWHLVERALDKENLLVQASTKSRSKLTPWV